MQEVLLDRAGKCDVDERFELPDLVDMITNELALLRALLARVPRRGRLPRIRERLWCFRQFARLRSSHGTGQRHVMMAAWVVRLVRGAKIISGRAGRCGTQYVRNGIPGEDFRP